MGGQAMAGAAVPRRGPSPWYYALALVFPLVGVPLFIIIMVVGLSGLSDQFERVVMPGGRDISLPRAGSYTIFYEYESVVDGRVFSTGENLSGMRCALVSKATGKEIPLTRSSVSARYSGGGCAGCAVLEFTVGEPGAYGLTGWYEEGRSGPEVVLAVGRGFGMRIFVTIIGGIAVMVGSFVMAGIVALVVFVRRRRAAAGSTAPSTPV